MMRRRDLKLAVLGVACTAALGLAANFTWVGQGEDDNWGTCDNWSVIGISQCCYPSSTSDDATIPQEEDPNGWSVKLIDVDRMDDLTIQGHVTFEAIDAPTCATLKVDSLLIDAVDEAEDTWVEITQCARILIEDPNSP